MNRPNQNTAMTRAGTRVDTSAEPDVEPPPTPKLPNTSDVVLEAFPREEPMLGSLFGSYQTTVSTRVSLGGGKSTAFSEFIQQKYPDAWQ